MKRSLVRVTMVGLLAVGGIAAAASAAESQPGLAIAVENHSVATKCAEEDNVYYTLGAAPGAPPIGGFRVAATSPAYLPVLRDSTAPDFADCSFGHDWAPDAHPYVPPTATLYEDDQYILKGVVYPDFWRPTVVPVTVGHLTQNFLHLVQLWKKTATGPVEFLVFYPQDGYWRLKALPPIEMREVAYGSSFLLGPIETSTRPFVAYKAVAFDPATLTFTIDFARGGKAIVALTDIRTGHAGLAVTLDHVEDAGQGIAGLRSMYVTPQRSDAAETRWQQSDATTQQVTDIVAFTSATATAVTFGRSVPSTHNTSGPDIGFSGFFGRR